jgi:hypothetical protein
MIVVRNVFQLKFGKAKEAVALLKEGLAIQTKALSGVEFSTRVLTEGVVLILITPRHEPPSAVARA